MAWPTTGAGTVNASYQAGGVTTIRWGTKELVTSINGVANDGISVGIVTRANERALVDNIKLPNGDGVTSTRVLIYDGVQWDIAIRDDTNLGIPKIGSTVVIVDMAGLIGNVGLKYSATVVEAGYDAAPKQAGERNFTIESLKLIESQSGT